MNNQMTTTEKWTCPDCGAVQHEIVPTECACQKHDTCNCGEAMAEGAEHCPACIEAMQCSGCGKPIDLEDEGECITCWEGKNRRSLMRDYLYTDMTLRIYLKKVAEVRDVVKNYRK